MKDKQGIYEGLVSAIQEIMALMKCQSDIPVLSSDMLAKNVPEQSKDT